MENECKAMCNACKHNSYCGVAYRKEHWCGNFMEKKYETNFIHRGNTRNLTYYNSVRKKNDIN